MVQCQRSILHTTTTTTTTTTSPDGQRPSTYNAGNRDAEHAAPVPRAKSVEGRPMVVTSAWNGTTSITNPITKETVQFHFPRRIRAFAAGHYALERNQNIPCFFYIDYNDSIYMYYNIRVGKGHLPTLAETLQPELAFHTDALAEALLSQNFPLLSNPSIPSATGSKSTTRPTTPVPVPPAAAGTPVPPSLSRSSSHASPRSVKSAKYPPVPPIDTSVSRTPQSNNSPLNPHYIAQHVNVAGGNTGGGPSSVQPSNNTRSNLSSSHNDSRPNSPRLDQTALSYSQMALALYECLHQTA
ncbi:hypothetical protein BJ085DRAFT_27666 [Dimargaris cristalligena]|uniref:Uncharacterized protein n=1 Tax=Dimargaris cristalligena TaxID=215637 RepID=A0A4P9ZLQ3_9FUNG|nr:hypothetical protein BJ085DRAFT_27666 [Dimargaris cristalligena]|eukprot:RKP34065.1 hypothetical protein BJ085DRAFT_27666 [Dimargaris cristalligena]